MSGWPRPWRRQPTRITNYLPTNISRKNEGGNDVDDTMKTTTTTDRLGAQIRTSVRGRPWGSTRVKDNFAAIYIYRCPALRFHRETVVFLGKQITGVDQRRGNDSPVLDVRRRDLRSFSANDIKYILPPGPKYLEYSRCKCIFLII